MATVARSAPLSGRSALVEDPQFQEMVERSRSLVDRILLSIPDTHNSCIVTEALLGAVSERLENTDKVTVLMAEIRDLIIQINKMLKMVQKDAVVQSTPTPVTLRLLGDYDVQVATHLTLVQLQAFGQDAVRCLRSLDQSNEEEPEI
ncbi:hypothetical protein INR49_013776 [Caranx melampygus]|nr:hypothetical protein INR49_013776 [Caranx melampygus]